MGRRRVAARLSTTRRGLAAACGSAPPCREAELGAGEEKYSGLAKLRLFRSPRLGILLAMPSRPPLMYVHSQMPVDVDRLRELQPDAIIEEIPGVGHYSMLTAPGQVNALLDRFLEVII